MSIKNGLARKRDEDWRKYAKTVRDGQRDFVKTGTALGMLRVEEHHKERGYASFEELVEAEFDMPKTTAYRLIEAARVVTVLSQLGTIQSKITNQAQALALSPVRKDGAALLAVVAAAEESGRITAASLEAARAELYPHAKVIDGEVVEPRRAVEGMRAAIEQAAAKNSPAYPTAASDPEPVEDARESSGQPGPWGGAERPAAPPAAQAGVGFHRVECTQPPPGGGGGPPPRPPPPPAALPVEVYHCEKCTKPLAEGIVKAAQRRCLGCDPNREHAAYEVGGPCMVCPTPCEACGEPVKSSDVQAGRLRCRPCDPSSQHKAITEGGEFTGECSECQLQARLAEKASAAVTAGNTEDASPALGEPDVDELAASTSGTKDSGENSSDGEDAQPRVAPVGSEPGYDGLGSGYPDLSSFDVGHFYEPEERIEEEAASAVLRCWFCTYGVEAVGDLDSALAELEGHLRSHDLDETQIHAALAVADPRIAIDSPAADPIEHSHAGVPAVGGYPETFDDLGCPRCSYVVEVSEEDPDASLSEMFNHISARCATGEGEERRRSARELLAQVRLISPAGAGIFSDPEVPAVATARPEIDHTSAEPWESPAEVVVRLFKAFTDELDAVDYEAVGPELTEIDLYAIQQCDARIADHLERLERFVRNT